MDNAKILIIEDDLDLRTQMKWGLSGKYNVLLAGTRGEALEIFEEERPLVVTLDLGLPPDPNGVEEGLLTLSRLLEQESLTKVIIISGRDEKEHALEAVGRGGF